MSDTDDGLHVDGASIQAVSNTRTPSARPEFSSLSSADTVTAISSTAVLVLTDIRANRWKTTSEDAVSAGREWDAAGNPVRNSLARSNVPAVDVQ